MSKSNVIQLPKPERDMEKKFLLTSILLGELLYDCAREALGRLQIAEAEGLTRLSEYVPQDRLLTLDETAAYLGFKPRTIDGWTRPGSIPKIPFILIGGEKRFRKTALDDCLTKMEVGRKTVKL